MTTVQVFIKKQFQTKDEFETEAQYKARVTDESIATLKKELTQEAEAAFIAKRSVNVVLQLSLGTYDAEKETFDVSDLSYGKFKVKVPMAAARDFKALWDGIVKTPTYCVKNDRMGIKSITFRMPDGTEFKTTE